MPLCGFNQEMLEGLEKFHEGLIRQLVKKVNRNEIIDNKSEEEH